jgi:cyclopropane fatty-acyl-phospholipid synthase-like methyltransferase
MLFVQWRTKTLPEVYDKDYFENGIKKGISGYENYRWLPKRIYREVRAVINLLGIEPTQTVFDYGCAKGYWVKGFQDYNINAEGYDISKYAIEHCHPDVRYWVYNDFLYKKYDFIVSRNTFEHLTEKELEEKLKQFLKITDTVFFTVPLIDPRTGDYVMQETDITHKIRWTNAQWMSFCEKCGWKEVISYNHIEGLHDKFKNYPNSMGFYLLKK